MALSPDTVTAAPHATVVRRTSVAARLRTLWGRAGDALALLPLVTVFWYLADHDGGWETYSLVRVAAVTLPAVVLAGIELARLPRVARLLLAAWPAGVLIALVAAVERSHWVKPTLVYGLVPVVGLLALRIWRRPWGPAALFLILLTSFGLYWYEAFLVWWGVVDAPDRTPTWMALSMLNQSGALMAGFGLLFLGVAATAGRLLSLCAGLAAAGAFAGLWLSGSRGSLVSAAVGVVALLVVVLRRSERWRGAVRVAAVSVAAVGIVWSLSAMGTTARGAGTTGAPVAHRQSDTATSAWLRLDYLEGAVGAFAGRPLTGTGVGSFGVMSREHMESWQLTASAHNEYAQMFAEGGIVAGVPFALLALLLVTASAAVGRRARSWPTIGQTDLRPPLAVGAVPATLTLLLHAGMDLDWFFPVIPFLLATTAAMLVRVRASAGDTAPLAPPRRAAWLVVPAAMAVIVGGVGALVETAPSLRDDRDGVAQPAPWESRGRRLVAAALIQRGDVDGAAATIAPALAWSPGDRSLQVFADVIAYRRGQVAGAQLVERLAADRAALCLHNLAAEALDEGGDDRLARQVLADVQELYPAYAHLRIDRSVLDTWRLAVRFEAEDGGCAAADDTIARALADPLLDHLDDEDVRDNLGNTRPLGC